VIRAGRVTEAVHARNRWLWELWRPTTHYPGRHIRGRADLQEINGVLHYKVWEDEFENLVVTAGKNYLLETSFRGGTAVTTWYVGLKDTGTVSASDTMGSHAGWAELAVYSNANRPTLTLAAAASGSTDNSASKASFTINATDDIYGGFVTSNNTISGTTGTLYGAGDFTVSPRSVISGDTLNVQVTLTV
jgi:hypothetical protein